MASIKDLKKRIGTVKNTQQTTKAMKMVSAAKLRRAQEAITHQRPYARRIAGLIRLLMTMPKVQVSSPLVHKDEEQDELSSGRRLLLVVVTSDRGLAGAFNANVIKATQRWIQANQGAYESIELAFVGKKGHDFFKNRPFTLGPYFQELGGKVTFVKAKKLADDVIGRYLEGTVNEVKFVYNEFKNAATQALAIEEFLPLRSDAQTAAVTDAAAIGPDFIVTPDPTTVLEDLLAKHFSAQTFRIMLESQASEHGARMSAMENATKNAGEMIRKLTLQYNKQRQASITKELLEIISGSESQKVD